MLANESVFTLISADRTDIEVVDLNFESEYAGQVPSPAGTWSFPLICLFQVTTGASLFFACLTCSPLLAIVLTLFITPAIVRTTLIADQLRRENDDLCWQRRSKFFVGSLGYVALVALFGLCVFLLISLMFGLMGLVFSLMVHASAISADAIVLGTVGGMVWGVVGGLLAMAAIVIRTWRPKNMGEV